MNKRIKSILAVMLCFILAMGFVGCRSKGDEANSGSGTTDNPFALDAELGNGNGTHSVSLVDTGKKLVENGATDYKIVVPASTDYNSKIAVSELQDFLKSSTGATFETAEATQYNADDKYIVVGQNDYSESAEIVYDIDTLKNTGVRITSKGNSIFIGGPSTKGTLNAVYEFLHHTVGFEIYAKDAIALNHENTVPLYTYDVTEAPDFEYRALAYGDVVNDGIYAARMRSDSTSSVFATIKRNTWHNTFEVVPQDVYLKNHSGWYSDDKKQLCYTAHGDSDEYAALQDVVFEAMKEAVIKNPSIENFPFTIEDNSSWCTCEHCAAAKQTYGTDAAVVIKFCNDLGAKMDEWVKENTDGVPHDRRVFITFFAYNAATDAPAVKNSDGTFSPIDETVKCRENVFVLYAPISAMYNQPFDSAENSVYYDALKGWSAVSDRIAIWVYQTNFHNYMYPYNSWHISQHNYKLFKDVNAMYLFDQGQYDTGRSTAFSSFKYFLTYKLAWNVDLDVAKLTDDYFKNVYGPAADTMRGLYEAERTHMRYLEDVKNITGNIYFGIADDEYFPKYTLDRFMEYIDKAMLDIAPLNETEPESYASFAEKIKVESMFPRFVLYNRYAGYYSQEQFAQLKNEFRSDAIRLGFTKWREGQDLFSIINSWN